MSLRPLSGRTLTAEESLWFRPPAVSEGDFPVGQADMDHCGTFAMPELDKALQKGGTTLPIMNNKIAPTAPSLMELLWATREIKKLAAKHLHEARRKSASSRQKQVTIPASGPGGKLD